MKNKILIITGPTATGKTNLGLRLAKKFKGEIISVDSRQVYTGMDVGTGKDLPKFAKFHSVSGELGGYYLFGKIKVWGYDLILPQKSFSVAEYMRYAENIINQVGKSEKLPILVGGSGLYVKALLDGIPTAEVPQNKLLRGKLTDKDLGELFENLAKLDPGRAGSLNSSDRKNPRRLIRAIEVATWKLTYGQVKKVEPVLGGWDSLIIGLSADKTTLDERIESRVNKRLIAGLEEEIKTLLKSGVNWDTPAMTSLGYRQWKEYFEKKMPLSGVVNNWIKEEKKYVKRQMTWFRKDNRINWFDISDVNYLGQVEKTVKKWYDNR